MINHQNLFSTNLTSDTLAGATTSPLNSIPTVAAPFYIAWDAGNTNGHFEVKQITSKTATNVNHSALSYAHTTSEEIRMIVPAEELDEYYTFIETGWKAYSDVIPTRASADDPTYVLTFAGVDLTSKIGVGMRVKFTQNSATVYGIVTAIAFSTNTTLTIYGGTDYDVLDTATYPITAFHFSGIKAPIGFPLNPVKWRITGGTTGSQVSPTINTWYNIGGNIVLPIGVWDVMYTANVYETHSSGDVEVDVTLGTTTSNSMDDAFRRANYTGTNALTSFVTARKHVSVSSKTTIYRNMLSARATTTQFWIDVGGGGTESIVAVCAYL